jgi:hypothetical protein
LNEEQDIVDSSARSARISRFETLSSSPKESRMGIGRRLKGACKKKTDSNDLGGHDCKNRTDFGQAKEWPQKAFYLFCVALPASSVSVCAVKISLTLLPCIRLNRLSGGTIEMLKS